MTSDITSEKFETIILKSCQKFVNLWNIKKVKTLVDTKNIAEVIAKNL